MASNTNNASNLTKGQLRQHVQRLLRDYTSVYIDGILTMSYDGYLEGSVGIADGAMLTIDSGVTVTVLSTLVHYEDNVTLR